MQHRKNFKSYNADGIEIWRQYFSSYQCNCRTGLSNKIYRRFVQLCRRNQLDQSFNSDWFRCISDRNVADICIILCYNWNRDIFLHYGAKGELFSFRSCHDNIRGTSLWSASIVMKSKYSVVPGFLGFLLVLFVGWVKSKIFITTESYSSICQSSD